MIGEVLTPRIWVEDDGTVAQNIMALIADVEEQIASLEEDQASYKAQLLEAMEKHGIKKIDNDYFTVNFMEESTGTGLDQTKLKSEFEEIYLQCVKKTTRKAFIKLKVKAGRPTK